MANDSLLGKLFAVADAEEQALFLNVAGRELRRTCGDREDIQVSRIVDQLDGNGRELIKKLAEYVEADERTPAIVRVVKYVETEVPAVVPDEEVAS